MSLLWLLLAVAHTDGGAITWQTRAPRTTNGLYTSADDDASARTSSSMPTRCPQSHDPRVGGLANRTSTTAADRYQWTLVPATNAPSRPHAPNAMRGRLNPSIRAASHPTSSRKQATDVRSRVGGHVDDPSPTAVHIRCYRATSTRSRLRTKSIFVFPIGSGEPRAWPQSHDARVDGRAPHVNDSSPTADHVRRSLNRRPWACPK